MRPGARHSELPPADKSGVRSQELEAQEYESSPEAAGTTIFLAIGVPQAQEEAVGVRFRLAVADVGANA